MLIEAVEDEVAIPTIVDGRDLAGGAADVPVLCSVVVPSVPLVGPEDSFVSAWDVKLVPPVVLVVPCDPESVDGPPDPLLLKPSVAPLSPEVELIAELHAECPGNIGLSQVVGADTIPPPPASRLRSR